METGTNTEYKRNLRNIQQEHIDRVSKIMNDQFGIKMTVFDSLFDLPDESVKKGVELFASLDPWALTCLS